MTTGIKTVGIAGTGQMASGIAEVAARSGHEVVLRGRSAESGERARKALETSLAKQVDKGGLSAGERDEALGRVQVTTDLDRLDACDLVVESVVEDLDVKKEMFRRLDAVCRDDAILATNTSTLPVLEVATATERPERVLGLHFFNPAPKMPLVEVIEATTTSPETVAAARAFAEELGKEPVTVKDSAGFIVNALLLPYLNSAVRMLEREVASKEDIDAAMKGGCGFPMGPLALLDLIGLDTSLSILQALHEDGDPCSAPADLLRRLVAEDHLGRKTGQGFYTYAAGK